jgi:hypothetical protein
MAGRWIGLTLDPKAARPTRTLIVPGPISVLGRLAREVLWATENRLPSCPEARETSSRADRETRRDGVRDPTAPLPRRFRMGMRADATDCLVAPHVPARSRTTPCPRRMIHCVTAPARRDDPVPATVRRVPIGEARAQVEGPASPLTASAEVPRVRRMPLRIRPGDPLPA